MKKLFGFVALISALSGCGGGGSDNSSSTTVATSAILTQGDVKNVASLGVATSFLTQIRVMPALALVGGMYGSYAVDTAGSRSSSAVACSGSNGGTWKATSVKSGVHVGLVVGDQVSIVFNKCDFAGDGTLINGSVKLTAQGSLASLPVGSYIMNFQVDMNGLSTSNQAGAVVTFAGIVDTVISGDSKSTNMKVSVPANQTFSSVYSGMSSGVRFAYTAGATFAASELTSPLTMAFKLDGTVIVGAVGAELPLVISTPVAISGPETPRSSSFIGTSGVINTKSTSLNLSTSTTFNGSTATVSGDTDGNGSMDTVFNSTWAALTAS